MTEAMTEVRKSNQIEDINDVNFTGRIATDLELKSTNSGLKVLNFTVAVNRRSHTVFVPCTAWNKAAEILAEHATKGMEVSIRGTLDDNSFVAKDGHNVSKMMVVIDKFKLHFKNAKTDNEPKPTVASNLEQVVEKIKSVINEGE